MSRAENSSREPSSHREPSGHRARRGATASAGTTCSWLGAAAPPGPDPSRPRATSVARARSARWRCRARGWVDVEPRNFRRVASPVRQEQTFYSTSLRETRRAVSEITPDPLPIRPLGTQRAPPRSRGRPRIVVRTAWWRICTRAPARRAVNAHRRFARSVRAATRGNDIGHAARGVRTGRGRFECRRLLGRCAEAPEEAGCRSRQRSREPRSRKHALAHAAPPVGTIQPPLLQAADVVHVGSFHVPLVQSASANLGFDYGGTAMSFNPARNSLFMVGHPWEQLVAELAIPPLGRNRVAAAAADRRDRRHAREHQPREHDREERRRNPAVGRQVDRQHVRLLRRLGLPGRVPHLTPDPPRHEGR